MKEGEGELKALRDASSCNTFNYSDAVYWDARYTKNSSPFDWYQPYSALRPFLHLYIPTSSPALMLGCGNAVISEEMVKDGYEDIVNVDISSVAISMMSKKYENIPQLKYMEMDVRDMSFFANESFDSVIDKGTLDALMCGESAPTSICQMLGEVGRLLKPGGTYMLISYGYPKVRIPQLNKGGHNWKITLYIIPKPGFQRRGDSSSSTSYMDAVPITENGLLPPDYVLEDPDSHFIYACRKMDRLAKPSTAIS